MTSATSPEPPAANEPTTLPPGNPLLKDASKANKGRGISPRTGIIIGAVALATIALLVAAGSFLGLFGPQQDEGLVFVIPANTNVARPGWDSAIAIPTDIRFKAGEPAVITVRNLDDETQRAGPFLIGPKQTYVQRFPDPGEYPIACSVDPLESIVVTVEA